MRRLIEAIVARMIPLLVLAVVFAPVALLMPQPGVQAAIKMPMIETAEQQYVIEDFTTYTEVDIPANRITFTSSRTTWTALERDEVCYLYDDKGAGHFDGNFTHLLDVYLDASDAAGQVHFWALQNHIGIPEVGLDGLYAFFYGTPRIYIKEINGGTQQTFYACSLDTPYYLKIQRDVTLGDYGTLYCYIYSDADRTQLLETLSLTLHENISYRYIYTTLIEYDEGKDDAQTGYAENLDLQEVTTEGPNYPSTVSTAAVEPEDDDDWVDPSNIGADDDSWASITANTFDNNDISYRLKAQNFGFSIPAGTVDGIAVEINRYCDAGSAADYRVQLLDADGALVGDNKADTVTAWPATEGIATYGGASANWSASLTPANVNDADFGVVLSVKSTSPNTDIFVDYIRVTIYYTVAAECCISEDISLYEFGLVDVGGNYTTGISYFSLYNCGDGSIDVYISAANMTGGAGWTLSSSAGDMIYALKAGLDDDDDNYDVTVALTDTLFINSMATNTTQPWGMQFFAPTVFQDGNDKSGNVTLAAVVDT